MPQPPAPDRSPRHRVPLRRNRKRLSYELRLRTSLFACMLPAVLLTAGIAWQFTASGPVTAASAAGALLLFGYATNVLFQHITRPLQTLANVVAALREDDFSFRARGARRGDSLGDLALEINALANTLQSQRTATRDALTLAERVMDAMRTPVLAFTAQGSLRLLNPAAENAFHLQREQALGQSAAMLGLTSLFQQNDGAVYAQPAVSGVAGDTRWSLHRSTFRLGGIPHNLFVLSDVQQALREEERRAWQRLIRVLSHEINNSLTPITSIAGSLRGRLNPGSAPRSEQAEDPLQKDLQRGLQLIEERALSLHGFLQAYQELTRLPPPSLKEVTLAELLQSVAALETRLNVQIKPGNTLQIYVDPVQMEQLLINLVRNAADATLSVNVPDHVPSVVLSWQTSSTEILISVEDNGPGLAETANLFVPFYTTKPHGTGVGLALAKQIASAHGGTLSLANRAGQSGCIAELRLPRKH